MNSALALSLLLAVATTTTAEATCKGQEGITVNTPANWPTKENGGPDHFTLLESEGVEVGIRVQEIVGYNLLTPTEMTVDGDTIGVYAVETGSANRWYRSYTILVEFRLVYRCAER